MRVWALAIMLVCVMLVLVACGGGAGASSSGTDESVGENQQQVVLRWRAPMARVDGSPLPMTDLAAYVIHYGRGEDEYTQSIEITDPYRQQYTLGGLAPGTYYVALTARDTNGNVSDYSEALRFSVR